MKIFGRLVRGIKGILKGAFVRILTALMVFAFLAFPSFAAEKIRIVDDAGREVVLEGAAKRIISLYTAHTENLFSLGLDDEIIGVSPSETYPPAALKKPVYSCREDPERVLAAKPDLVVIRPLILNRYPDFVHKLEIAHIPVAVLFPETVEEFYEYMVTLGKLTGREEEAKRLVADFKERLRHIDEIVAKVPLNERKKVFFESRHKDVKTTTPDSLASFVLQHAGAINVASDAKAVRPGSTIASYGIERLLSKAREIDVYVAQKGVMNRITERDIYKTPGFSVIKAVKDKEVYLVDEEIISRATMRLLDGIVEVGRMLYPNLFSELESGEGG